MAALVNMGLGILVLLSIGLANDRLSALWSAGFVGIGLLVWGGLGVWASSGAHLRGTKLLAIFMLILGIDLIGMAWLIDTSRTYQWVATVLGALVIMVSLIETFLSPGEERRSAFEPRRAEDSARPPTAP